MNNQLIYGKHPVIDAITSGRDIDKVILQQDISKELEGEIRKLCSEHNIVLQYVPKERINKLVEGNHQGVVAYLSLITYFEVEEIVSAIVSTTVNPVVLVIESITDVRNFGAIARSAECAGVSAIIVPYKGIAPVNSESIKSSAGALTKLSICRTHSIGSTIKFLKLNGFYMVAGDLKATKPLYEIDFQQSVAIVIGAEDKGISFNVLKKLDDTFIIPQIGTTDSYNISVATGISLYEMLRQRQIATVSKS